MTARLLLRIALAITCPLWILPLIFWELAGEVLE